MAELSNVKSILEGKKTNQKTNRTIPKKAKAKPSKKQVETVLPKILTEVGNLVSELKPKIQKTSQTKKVVKKSKNVEAISKKLVPRTLACHTQKQILLSEPKAQESKEVTISTIPVHKEVETNKVEVKKKMDVKKIKIKSVEAKTMQPKSTTKSTTKSGSMKVKEELKPPKTDDVKQTKAKNKQSVNEYKCDFLTNINIYIYLFFLSFSRLQIKVKRVLKKKLNTLSSGGKIVIPRTPGVKN